MIPFILDESGRTALKNLKEYAELNPIEAAKLLEMMKGKIPAVGNDPNYTCHLPVGFRVVYSIENQPAGKLRHLSVSLNDGKDGKVPNVNVVCLLMLEFGFKRQIEDVIRVWIEDGFAINVIDLCD